MKMTMNKKLCSLLILAALLASASPSPAQLTTYTLDPAININDIWVMSEFKSPPDPGPWNMDGLNTFGNPVLAVTNGVLRAETTGGGANIWTYQSPDFSPQWLDNPTNMTILEARLRVLEGATYGWILYVGNSPYPGAPLPWSLNNVQVPFTFDLGFTNHDWHIVQWDMTNDLAGTPLLDFMLTLGPISGTQVEFDYIRLGTISPDTDGDGLPDNAETGTGFFTDRRNTGTDPHNPDTDGDGFKDGLEVEVGTDPNNAASSPEPAIQAWTTPVGQYIVSVPIETNSPIVQVGVPQSFTISPSLPTGLSINLTNGQISGVPVTPNSNTTYTIITTFVGGKTGMNTVSIEVRNPYISYGAGSDRTFSTNTVVHPFQPFSPAVYGPPPTNFVISPTLPAGLSLNPTNGEIYGTPIAYCPRTVYTNTASYEGFADSLAIITIAVLEDVQLRFDPADLLSKYNYYESIGEFDANPDLPHWTGGMTVDSPGAGSLLITTTDNLPFALWWLYTYEDHRVVEMRIKITAGGGVPWYPLWVEDGKFGFDVLLFQIPWDEARNDGQFHVYQLDFTKASEKKFGAFRLDPGYNDPGLGLEVDYIRIGTLAPGALPPLEATLSDGKVRVSWPASVRATLQSATTMAGAWANATNAVTSDPTTSWILEEPVGTRFYRLTR